MKQIKFAIALLMAIAMLLSLAACGDKGPDVTGKYICVGESYYDAPLEEPYQESWLELKKGGKGIYYSGFEFNIKWKLDGEAFSATVSFLGMEDTMEGTLKDGVIDVKYGDMTIRFVKEGVEVPAGSELAGGSSGVNAPGGTGVTGANDGVLVAGSLADAFSGASAGVPGGSETAVIENPSTWYGWLALTDFWGIDQEEDIYDAWAYVNMDSTGKPYFEVFQDGDSENPFLSMYMTIEENGTCIMPDIGTEDAWTVDTYLNAEDAENYQTFLNEDGSLMLSYDYTRYDGAYGCSVTMFFREDGAQWDEETTFFPHGMMNTRRRWSKVTRITVRAPSLLLKETTASPMRQPMVSWISIRSRLDSPGSNIRPATRTGMPGPHTRRSLSSLAARTAKDA